MSDTKYAYAVARIRAMELSLFSSSTLDQLMALKTYESCLQFLTEKGWGDQDTGMDAEAILTREKEKTWNVVRDLLKKGGCGDYQCPVLRKSLPQPEGGNQGNGHFRSSREHLF